jgi:hypothetical protein
MKVYVQKITYMWMLTAILLVRAEHLWSKNLKSEVWNDPNSKVFWAQTWCHKWKITHLYSCDGSHSKFCMKFPSSSMYKVHEMNSMFSHHQDISLCVWNMKNPKIWNSPCPKHLWRRDNHVIAKNCNQPKCLSIIDWIN